MTDAEAIRQAVDVADPFIDRLSRAGCVFAAEEVALLREVACSPGELDALCTRRVAGEPVEHIVGGVRFGDLRLSVGPGVFVPRQRSRLLATVAIDAVRSGRRRMVLEAFCGVAPIASALRQAMPRLEIHAADIDEGALGYADVNLAGVAQLHRGSGFGALPETMQGRIDVIAAVAPYVPTTAREFLPREALDHEPHRALFGGPDGLRHIRRLIDEASEWLSDAGRLVLEMHRDQVAEVTSRATGNGFAVETFWGDDRQTAVVGMHRAR